MTLEKAVEVLERRIQHLTERIKKAKGGKNLSYDRRERAALNKVLEVIEDSFDYLEEDDMASIREAMEGCALTEEECEALGIDFVQHHLGIVR